MTNASNPEAQRMPRLEAVARELVQQLNSAYVGIEERRLLQELLEQTRPHVDPSVFEGYHERQTELCMPFARRFGMLHSTYSYEPYEARVLDTIDEVRSIIRGSGFNWQELAGMNELGVAAFLPEQEAHQLILFLTIIQALVHPRVAEPQPA